MSFENCVGDGEGIGVEEVEYINAGEGEGARMNRWEKNTGLQSFDN